MSKERNAGTFFSYLRMEEFRLQFSATWQLWAVRMLLGDPHEGGWAPEREIDLIVALLVCTGQKPNCEAFHNYMLTFATQILKFLWMYFIRYLCSEFLHKANFSLIARCAICNSLCFCIGIFGGLCYFTRLYGYKTFKRLFNQREKGKAKPKLKIQKRETIWEKAGKVWEQFLALDLENRLTRIGKKQAFVTHRDTMQDFYLPSQVRGKGWNDRKIHCIQNISTE